MTLVDKLIDKLFIKTIECLPMYEPTILGWVVGWIGGGLVVLFLTWLWYKITFDWGRRSVE